VGYLKAPADTRVFYAKMIDLSSEREILTAALAAEKDSIVFYLGLRDLVPERMGRYRVDDIISEEMEHVRIIGSRLLELSTSKGEM
jgi:rubrerythrin